MSLLTRELISLSSEFVKYVARIRKYLYHQILILFSQLLFVSEKGHELFKQQRHELFKQNDMNYSNNNLCKLSNS